MKIISIPFLSRGPEVETSIGIFIILVIVAIVLFSGYSTYKSLTETLEENVNYLNKTPEL